MMPPQTALVDTAARLVTETSEASPEAQLLRLFLQHTEEGVTIATPEGTLVYVNPRQAQQLGYEPEELQGRSWEVLVPREATQKQAWEEFLTAVRMGREWQGTLRQQAKDGTVLVFAVRAFPLGNSGEAPEGWLLLQQAVPAGTQQANHTGLSPAEREAEATRLLFEQSERLTRVSRLTADTLATSNVTETSERVVEELQADLPTERVALLVMDTDSGRLRLAAARGFPSPDLPTEPLPLETLPNVAEAFRAGRPVAAHSHPDGLAACAVVPLVAGEEPLGALLVGEAPDLDQLHVYAPHVAAALRNAILADALAAANEELREIDRQKSEFLNMVAHDLRTPLTSIRTYADLILMYRNEPPETYERFLRVIIEESNRLAELINNFLDLARIEAGTMTYQYEAVDLRRVVEHFLEVYRSTAESRHITLIADLPPELPMFYGDRQRLEQVFANLLSNALKFTPEGGRITLAMREVREGREPYLEVSVTDTGPGVPLTDRERIFEKFVQVNDHLRGRKGGTGLGLAIAKEIIEHHGGRIWVEDGPEGGARFVFTLPSPPSPS